MRSGQPEGIVNHEGQTSEEHLQLGENISVTSSSHKDDWNERSIRGNATAETIKQDRSEASALGAKPKAKLYEKMNFISAN